MVPEGFIQKCFEMEEIAGCLEAAAQASLGYACEESRTTSPRIRPIIITIHMGLDLIS